MTAAPRVLALATLLAVGAQTLSYGGANGRHAATGVERYAKLDRFLHDRLGLPGVFGGGGVGNRSSPPSPTTDRGLLSRTATASVAVPEDDDDDGAENEDGDDDDDDEEEEQEEQEQQDEKDKVTPAPIVRLRHKNAAAVAAAVAAEKDLDVYGKDIQKYEPPRTMSPISENKWKFISSRKNVEETFRNSHKINLLKGDGEGGEAYNHQKRISKEASCKVPRSRVIKVTDVYPSSNKKYLPACTILHVCAEDTGCCNSPTLKCGPKMSQPIYLPFLVYTVPGLGDWKSFEQSSIQKSLLFYNHTECECQSRTDDLMPRDTISTASVVTLDPLPPHKRRSEKYNQNSCKCPIEYTVRYSSDGSCSCDCFDKQRECIRHKKGNVYFNHQDRYCIASEQCLQPMCEYGVYSPRTGRCPKQFETLYSLNKKHYF